MIFIADSSAGFLNDKLETSSGLISTIVDNGGNKKIRLSVSQDTINSKSVAIKIDPSKLAPDADTNDIVYMDTDGIFKPAAIENLKSLVCLLDRENELIYVSGLVPFSNSYDSGTKLYLTENSPGHLSNEEVGLPLAITYDSNSIILKGNGIGGGTGDVTFEDLSYYFLLDDAPFAHIYYDIFKKDGTITLVSGNAGFNYNESCYEITADSSHPTIFEQTILDGYEDTIYRFLVHVTADDNPTVEYSIDNGNSWIECELDKIILVSQGFQNLKVRFTFTTNTKFYSFGVLYKFQYNSYISNYRMFEVLNVDSDIPHGTNIHIPHNSRYTTDGKSLEVYVNGIRMINGVDFTEIDTRTISFTSLDLKAGDQIIFIEQFGYVDLSIENNSKLQQVFPEWTDNLADYIVLRDQSNGNAYKLYFDNNELKYEQI